MTLSISGRALADDQGAPWVAYCSIFNIAAIILNS